MMRWRQSNGRFTWCRRLSRPVIFSFLVLAVASACADESNDSGTSASSSRTTDGEVSEERLSALFDEVEAALMAQNYAEAKGVFDEVEEIFTAFDQEKLAALPPSTRCRYHLTKARTLLHEKKVVEALEAAETARFLCEQNGDSHLTATIHRTLGNIFMVMRDYGRALQYFEHTLALAEDLEDHEMTAFTLNSIAIAYWRMKQWEEAETYLRQARKARGDDPGNEAVFNNNIAVALLEQGRFNRAEKLFRETLDFQKEADNPYAVALLQSNLGDLYQRKGQPQQALGFLDKSMQIPDTGRNHFVFARSLRHKARVLADLDRFEEAIAACEKSLAYGRDLQDRAELMDSYEALLELYESAGNYKAALEALRKRTGLKEEILSDQTRLQSAQFKARYEFSEQERRMRELQQEKRIQQLQRNATLLVLFLLLVIIVILIFRSRLHRRASRRISEQKAEIEQSHASLQEAYTRLEELNREKDEILGIAAHDLRNPIGAIRQVAHLLREDGAVESHSERKEMLEGITHSADTVLDILSNLLDLNRLENSAISVTWEKVECTEIVDAALRHYNAEAIRKKQSINHQPCPEGPPVHGDRILLQQIIGNLLSNAIKYSPPESAIHIDVGPAENRSMVRFVVRDEGPGLTKEDQRRLFLKFARLSTRPTGGETSTGLGLSIVKKLVGMMHGRVYCESVLGHGSTFIVEIPAAKEDEDYDSTTSEGL